MEDAKYFVVKVTDWEDLVAQISAENEQVGPRWYHHAILHLNSQAVDDAVVIRHQDVFAASAFSEYASQIRTALEVFSHLSDERDLSQAEVERWRELEDLADFFTSHAREAEDCSKRKLPD